ncbi:hypothetical protein [Pannonibacter tanglangensis]|uniref:Uncharacterized protein n=1 Tax=Pannonibacter tanglangensis TaxID=2750084 RepID=A0ABW9ZI54_9HYPH|nr:hypothetical protein [Pannonibacter sp. XCT-34]NBN64542.1 hypothetical protein [Pannonibacter sp. XCT-34]
MKTARSRKPRAGVLKVASIVIPALRLAWPDDVGVVELFQHAPARRRQPRCRVKKQLKYDVTEFSLPA